jgi:hypothetical protein
MERRKTVASQQINGHTSLQVPIDLSIPASNGDVQ